MPEVSRERRNNAAGIFLVFFMIFPLFSLFLLVFRRIGGISNFDRRYVDNYINKSNRARTIDAFSSVFVLVFVLILVPVLLTVA